MDEAEHEELAATPSDPPAGGRSALHDCDVLCSMPLRWSSGLLKPEKIKCVDFMSGSGGAEGGTVCPDVETLARWLANEEWMPNPSVGGSTRTSPADAALAERIWEQLPFGLRAWCLRHEAGMWKGGELLPGISGKTNPGRSQRSLRPKQTLGKS